MAKQKRLSEKQKAKILADYVLLGSYNAAAKKNKCSPNTVKRLVMASPAEVQAGEDGKNACARDMLSYMEGQRDAVCSIIGMGLAALQSPKMMATATPNQITTAIGTLIDKWSMLEQLKRTAENSIIEVRIGDGGEEYAK